LSNSKSTKSDAAGGSRKESPRRSNGSGRQLLIARAALVVLALLLLFLGILRRGTPGLIDGPLWDLQQTSHVKALILSLGMAGMAEMVTYFLIGFIAVQCVPLRKNNMLARGRSLLSALAMGIGLSAVVSTAAAGPGVQWPNLLDIILPSVGCLIGSWIGVSWAVGGRARWWILPKLALAGGGGVVAVAGLALLMIESEPLAFQPAKLVSAERVRLTQLIRSKSPRTIPDGETQTLTLTERDIDLLLAWGLSLGSADRKAGIELANDLATLQASIRLPTGDRFARYLNIVVAGRVGVEQGVLRVQIARLRVGRIGVPRPLLWLLSPGLTAKIRSEPLAVPMLAEIHRTEITAEHVSATYGRIDMPDGFRNDIFGSVGPDEQVYEALTVQFEQITKLGNALPPSRGHFETFLRAAFRLAHERSETYDPVVENRAAIIALGISLGHGLIGEFVGTIPHDKVPRLSASLTRRVRLRGRVDWSRHFLVSAALEVISTEAMSHDVGVLKEELDVGTAGGSGFSFADLAADRSGTMFGKIATQDATSALAIQQRLRDGFDVNDYVAETDDLPENITLHRLEAQYGGVNGNEYRRLLSEIDRRIAACAAYQ
jgi:hypothetical protein